jgi:hypothetical protein
MEGKSGKRHGMSEYGLWGMVFSGPEHFLKGMAK